MRTSGSIGGVVGPATIGDPFREGGGPPGASRRRGAVGANLDRGGDPGVLVLGVRHPDAVAGLEHPQRHPLAAEGDDTVGPDIDTDGGAGRVDLHLPAHRVDPADDPVEVDERPNATWYLHGPCFLGRGYSSDW